MMPKENYKTGMKIEPGKLYNGENGVYRYINNKMYSAIIKVPEIYTGDKLEESIIGIQLPKIPYEMFNKIYEFFKYVYKTHKSEVAILLWHNFETKDWDTEVPTQTVGGASVSYTRNESFKDEMEAKGFTCVGTIHSHCEMGAFHSGIDDHDEYNFDGVHITIGKVISGPQFAQRFIVKGMFRKFETIADVVDMPEVTEPNFPNEWSEQVKKHVYIPAKNGKNWKYNKGKNNNIKEDFIGYGFDKDGAVTVDDGAWKKEEINNEEKRRNVAYHYNHQEDTYTCPLCFGEFIPTQLGKTLTCPHCDFPMYEDSSLYLMETVQDKKGNLQEQSYPMDEDAYDIPIDVEGTENLQNFL